MNKMQARSLALACAFALAGIPAEAKDESIAIKSSKVAQALTERDLDDPAWDKIPESVVGLTTAFPGHPSITGTAAVGQVKVRVARTAGGLVVRLQWPDAVPDTTREQAKFSDGAAIQFALDRKPSTTPFMGGGGKLVNIWYWNAAKNQGENLIADGFGSLTPLKSQDVKAYGRHANGMWTVAFFRGYKASDPDSIKLSARAGGKYPVAFAVWEGANQERDGFKAVTMLWQSLGL